MELVDPRHTILHEKVQEVWWIPPTDTQGCYLDRISHAMLDFLSTTDEWTLAANQIGFPIRMFVSNIGLPGAVHHQVWINPTVLSEEGSYTDEEICLNMPGIKVEVTRPELIVVEAQNIIGRKFTIELRRTVARVMQHAIDHLDGLTIIGHSCIWPVEGYQGA